jgi:hypothetical protein
MLEKSLMDLINRKIDGVLTPQEEGRLAQRLATDADARNLFDDFLRQGRLVQKMAVVDPPATLKPAIMRTIARPAHRARSGRIADSFAWLFSTRRRIYYAFAFSGGVVAGMLILAVGLGIVRVGSHQESDAAGTSIIEPTNPVFQPIEERKIGLGDLQGTISTASGRGEHQITIQFQGPEDTRLQLALQPETVDVTGIESLDGSKADYTMRPGGIELRGRMACRLTLRGAASFRVTVSASGNKAYDGEFLLSP